MNNNIYIKKTPRFMLFVMFLVTIFLFQSMYLFIFKGMNDNTKNKKNSFVKVCKLPDLAISTEATFVRHRSMSDLFSIYKDDGSLREYFPSTYIYSHSHIINGKKDEK